MNGTDGFLDIHDSHLRVLDGNIHAKSIILDQLDITSSNTTSSTVQFLNGVTAFKTTANVEIGTANLFVDTSTSNVGILTSTPTHTLDVRGTANVEVLRTSSNIEMNGGTFSLGGHMIPSTNEQYDIGSAEYKIRDMYVSDNSLWIGDKAKISFDTTEDKLTFRKRKVSDTFIPAKIIDLATVGGIGDNTTDITNDIIGKPYTPVNLGAMKLPHWLQYAKEFQPNIKLSDIFASTNSDYDSTSTAEGSFSGTGALTLPSGTTAQQPTGVTGMIRFNETVGKMEFYNGTVWLSIAGISATGGTITNADGYKIHTFTSSGTFTMITGGDVEYLIVAGGGGGGSVHAGGGGAGGVLFGTISKSPGSYTVTVGNGGAGHSGSPSANGTNGSPSKITNWLSGAATISADGGGGGGSGYHASNASVLSRAGSAGGSGGGGGPYHGGGSGTSGQGSDGGSGGNDTVAGHGGGGGGAGGAGGNSVSPHTSNGGISGAGGTGHTSSITGTSIIYAGGGSGGRWTGNNTSPGEVQSVGVVEGGGGLGGARTLPNTTDVEGYLAQNAEANTGGGGGGGGDSAGPGGNGGSGIVILRYLL